MMPTETSSGSDDQKGKNIKLSMKFSHQTMKGRTLALFFAILAVGCIFACLMMCRRIRAQSQMIVKFGGTTIALEKDQTFKNKSISQDLIGRFSENTSKFLTPVKGSRVVLFKGRSITSKFTFVAQFTNQELVKGVLYQTHHYPNDGIYYVEINERRQNSGCVDFRNEVTCRGFALNMIIGCAIEKHDIAIAYDPSVFP